MPHQPHNTRNYRGVCGVACVRQGTVIVKTAPNYKPWIAGCILAIVAIWFIRFYV